MRWLIMIALVAGCAKSERAEQTPELPKRRAAVSSNAPKYPTLERKAPQGPPGLTRETLKDPDYLSRYQEKLDEYHERKAERLGQPLPQVTVGNLDGRGPTVRRARSGDE